jgi:hypothetical protein|tara:strand:- start:65 stop:223 length:159 start_codon:yes stop_codon:yes gene_type:complete
MINNGICTDCGHRHRGIAECSFCDCVLETVLVLKESFIKRLWNKIKSWIGLV